MSRGAYARPVFAFVLAAALALPANGVLVPGTSLGGVALGASQAEVRAAWGSRFGRCLSCSLPTWYFTYRPFTRPGAAIRFRNGRVDAVYTIWRPRGWRTRQGLRLGERSHRITAIYGPLARRACGSYDALTQPGTTADTHFFVVADRVWGFGLSRPGARLCP